MSNLYLLKIAQDLKESLKKSFQEYTFEEIDSLESIQQTDESSHFIVCLGQDYDLTAQENTLKEMLEHYSHAFFVAFIPSKTAPSFLEQLSIFVLSPSPSPFDLELLTFLTSQHPSGEDKDMQKIQKDYDTHIFSKLTMLTNLVKQYTQDPTPDNLEVLKKAVHKLAGSAGLYGYNKVSQTCKNYEQTLKDAQEKNTPLEKDEIDKHLETIKKAFLIKDPIKEETSKAPIDKTPLPEEKKSLTSCDLYLVDDDLDLLKALELESKNHSLTCSFESSFEKAHQKLSDPSFVPQILVLDLYSDKEQLTGYDLLKTFHDSQKNTSQTVIGILSAKGELQERKKAGDLVIDIYFEKPITPSFLFYEIKKLINFDQNNFYSVLLVDDDEDFCKSIESILVSTNFQLTYRTDPSTFFKDIEQTSPDLLLLDLSLPDISGLDLLNALRSDYRYRKIPVVIITVDENKENIKKAFELGINSYITKPVSPEHFTAQLSTILKKHQTQNIIYEKDQTLDVYTKQSLIQNFITYSINSKILSVVSLNFSALNQQTVELSLIKKTTHFIIEFFSAKDLLGQWSHLSLILLITYLAPKQLRLIIENLFKEMKNQQLFPQDIGLNACLSSFPSSGKTLEEIQLQALKALKDLDNKKLWQIISSTPSQEFFSGKGPTLLFITSDDTLFNLISYTLRLRDFAVIREQSGEKAYKALNKAFLKSPPDIILLDENLDDEDPIVLLGKMKNLIGERIPIIFLTSKTREGDIIEGLTKGATSYIMKPFSINLLIQRIHQRTL